MKELARYQLVTMTDSLWLNGPKDILCNVNDQGDSEKDPEYPLVNLDGNNFKTEVKSETVPVKQSDIGSRFEHFSSWYGVKGAISNLKHVASRKSAKDHTKCCQLIRFDCGTNFVGAAKELNADVISSDVRDFLSRKGITLNFNSAHSSHIGGVWERLIGVSRKTLDSLFSGVAHKNLTHEV